jgi:hypothetical protein
MIIDAIILTMLNMKFSLFRFYDLIVNSGWFFWTANIIDTMTTIFFIVAIILCYIAFWGRFTINKTKHKLYSIIIICGIIWAYI